MSPTRTGLYMKTIKNPKVTRALLLVAAIYLTLMALVALIASPVLPPVVLFGALCFWAALAFTKWVESGPGRTKEEARRLRKHYANCVE